MNDFKFLHYIANCNALSMKNNVICSEFDSQDYIGYENKRVVVVGIGNSGGDVAVELGRISKQVSHFNEDYGSRIPFFL